MRTFPRKNAPVLAYALGFGFVALAGQANASCLSGLVPGAHPDKSSPPAAPASTSVPLVQAVYRPGQEASQLLRVGDRDDNNDEPIVGLRPVVLNGDLESAPH